MAKEKKEKPAVPGNDVLNGIERWLPQEGAKVPAQFKHKSENGIWYKSEREERICLSRNGVDQALWKDDFVGGSK